MNGGVREGSPQSAAVCFLYGLFVCVELAKTAKLLFALIYLSKILQNR
jgi:hypothetical protein